MGLPCCKHLLCTGKRLTRKSMGSVFIWETVDRWRYNAVLCALWQDTMPGRGLRFSCAHSIVNVYTVGVIWLQPHHPRPRLSSWSSPLWQEGSCCLARSCFESKKTAPIWEWMVLFRQTGYGSKNHRRLTYAEPSISQVEKTCNFIDTSRKDLRQFGDSLHLLFKYFQDCFFACFFVRNLHNINALR